MKSSDHALQFDRDGAQHFPGALSQSELDALRLNLADAPSDQPGVRLVGMTGAKCLFSTAGAVGAIAAQALGPASKPVRAVLFDKTPQMNWALGWHQDRTIVVRRRLAVDGFGPWSTKAGLQHVEPPFALLEGMITLRVHLDDVDEDNAPLVIALGSHRLGRIPVERIDRTIEASDIRSCLAKAADVWMYSTPVLHASDAAKAAARRRVLQVDYAAVELPGGLAWMGV